MAATNRTSNGVYIIFNTLIYVISLLIIRVYYERGLYCKTQLFMLPIFFDGPFVTIFYSNYITFAARY